MNSEWWINLGSLDADQHGILNLPLDQNHLVLGPPGSGKTNLLLLRANYVAKVTPNILVVVFGRTLREFLSKGAGQYKFSPEMLKTSARCFYDLLKEYGRDAPDDGLPFEQTRNELVQRVRALRATLPSPPYEAIFLDEAQDFLPEEIEVFMSLAKTLFAVADSRQQLYRGGSCLNNLAGRCTIHQLRHHYRSGVAICRLADSIGMGMPDYERTLPTCRYSEERNASSVEWFEMDFDNQVKCIVNQLAVQTKAFPNEMLAIICPKNADVQRMHNALVHTEIADKIVMQSSENGYSSFDPNTPVCLTTMHGCKGLEFRAVHGAMMESLRRFPLQRNLIFTLATRAKTSLTIYGDPIPPFVKGAILAVSPPRTLPSLNQAFGGDDA